MADVKDILGVSRTAEKPAEKADAKPKAPKRVRPEGMSREAFALLGDSHPIISTQLVPQKKEVKAKPKPSTKGFVTWLYKPIQSSARKDDLQLFHWVKAYKDAAGRVKEEEDTDYQFAKFNKKASQGAHAGPRCALPWSGRQCPGVHRTTQQAQCSGTTGHRQRAARLRRAEASARKQSLGLRAHTQRPQQPHAHSRSATQLTHSSAPALHTWPADSARSAAVPQTRTQSPLPRPEPTVTPTACLSVCVSSTVRPFLTASCPQVQLLKYNDEEYDHLIRPDSGDWSRAETDYLMELCERFDLRFIVIADRYEVRNTHTHADTHTHTHT